MKATQEILDRMMAKRAAKAAAPKAETVEERILRRAAERYVARFADALGAAAPLLDAHEFLGSAEMTEHLVRSGHLGYDETTAMVTCPMG